MTRRATQPVLERETKSAPSSLSVLSPCVLLASAGAGLGLDQTVFRNIAALLLLGVFILTGLDKRFETWVLDTAPAWLTQIGTSL